MADANAKQRTSSVAQKLVDTVLAIHADLSTSISPFTPAQTFTSFTSGPSAASKYPILSSTDPSLGDRINPNDLGSSSNGSGRNKLPASYRQRITLSAKRFAMYHEYLDSEASSVRRSIVSNFEEAVGRYKPEIKFDEQEQFQFESVYNRPEVMSALMLTLGSIIVDYLLFGCAVFAVPRDMLAWACDKRGWVLGDSGSNQSHLPKRSSLRNRLPHADHSFLVPFSHVGLQHGDLTIYDDSQTATCVGVFTPVSQYAKDLEKKFRTVVILDPRSTPSATGVTTGLDELYVLFVQMRLAGIQMRQAATQRSRTIMISHARLERKNLAERTDDDIVNEVTDLGELGGCNSHDLQNLRAVFNMTASDGQRLLTSLDVSDTVSDLTNLSNQNIQRGTKSAQAAAKAAGDRSGTDGQSNIPSLSVLSPAQLRALDYHAVDQPVLPSQSRDLWSIPVPPATQITHVMLAEPQLATYTLAMQLYEARKAEMFGFTDAFSNVARGTTTIVSANEGEQMKLARIGLSLRTMKAAEVIFATLYREAGAQLEVATLAETMSDLFAELNDMSILSVMRSYVQTEMQRLDLTPETLFEALATSSELDADDADSVALVQSPSGARNNNNNKSKRHKHAGRPASKVKLALPLSTMQQLTDMNAQRRLTQSIDGITRVLIYLEQIIRVAPQSGARLVFNHTPVEILDAAEKKLANP